MKYIIAIITGLIVGGYSHDGDGYLVGGIIGYLFIQLLDLKVKISSLEKKLKHRPSNPVNISEKEKNIQPPDKEIKPAEPINTEFPVAPNELIDSLEPLQNNISSSAADYLNQNTQTMSIKSSNTQDDSQNSINEMASSEMPENFEALKPELEKAELEKPEIKKIKLEKPETEPTPETIEPRPIKKALPIKTEPTAVEVVISKLKSMVIGYFTGGNSLVRTGMLVLFIGVAFLLKYVAERTVVPVEFRYIGISLACLIMLVLGWKLRKKRPGFALSLEGGGIGLLYLTLFSALRLHGLLPPSIVLILLIAIVLLSAVLAIFQDSMALAIIGMIGGFAAPILTSTGSGSHVQLFSYYLLLNVGVFAIAWFKSWRILNVIGFVATFGIGSIWGYKFYKPEFLTSVEPFLIIYFLLYTFIAVLYALKQPPKLKGINDGTIIFGTPMVGFALQAALMKDSEYGLAYSALALGAFYVIFAYFIHLMKKPYMKDLIESFVALGIGFATLAIPLGFDGRVTSAMWVAEGCALLWVGIRQSRMFPRFSGYALTFLGMLAFFVEKKSTSELMPWLNADYVGSLIIVLSTAFIALYVRKYANKLLMIEGKWIPSIMIVLSVSWWVYGGMLEIYIHYPQIQFIRFELFLALTAVALIFISDKINFNLVKILSIFVAMIMIIILGIFIPHINSELNAFTNVRYIGLLIFSISHLYFSWYWGLEKRHKLIKVVNNISDMFLITGLSSWLYMWTTELSAFYPSQQFVLLETMLAITAFSLLLAGIKLKLFHFKRASVVVTLLMIIPLIKIPESTQLLPVVLNIPFLGLLIYTATHFLMSWYWQTDKSLNNNSLPMKTSNLMLVLALFAWIYTGNNEIYSYLSSEYFINLSMVFMSVSFVIWLLFANRLNWKSMHLLSYAFLPYLIIVSYTILAKGHEFHDGYGIFVWLLAAAVNYWILKVYDKKMQFNDLYHFGSLLFIAFITIFEFNEFIKYALGSENIWQQASSCFMLLLISIGLYTLRGIKVWPLGQYKTTYFINGLATLSVILWLMVIALNLSVPNQSTLISYMPILNIIDIIGIIFVIFIWKILINKTLKITKEINKMMMIALSVTAFFILNTSMLRSLHFWYSIDYKFNTLISSFLVQSAFSILWSLTAVFLMVLSAKKHWRTVWLVGLGIMVAVVVKLFLVDMSASGTVERIVAFLSVGVLLSLVGYFSPLPPDVEKINDQILNKTTEQVEEQ
jgi:uncharacterized membrane protein